MDRSLGAELARVADPQVGDRLRHGKHANSSCHVRCSHAQRAQRAATHMDLVWKIGKVGPCAS